MPLFERLPRGMRPTWVGETMIRHARGVLSSLNQAHDELMERLQKNKLDMLVARLFAQHDKSELLFTTRMLVLPCPMDAFGIITRRDRLLSPAGKIMLRAMRTAASSVYGARLDLADD